MSNSTWALTKPLSAIVFDCDGTLTTIEGIDELAAMNGTSEHVSAMTQAAMTSLGITPEIYEKRLALANPFASNITALSDRYIKNEVPDIKDVVSLYKKLGKSIYIVSAGLAPSIILFAAHLGIPAENVFAVDIKFNEGLQYVDFDHASPLIHHSGKRIIITEILAKHSQIAFIGDGVNDLIAADIPTRFIGYGGIYFRQNIMDECRYYVKSRSMTGILPLTLTDDEINGLNQDEKALVEKGMKAIVNGEIKI